MDFVDGKEPFPAAIMSLALLLQLLPQLQHATAVAHPTGLALLKRLFFQVHSQYCFILHAVASELSCRGIDSAREMSFGLTRKNPRQPSLACACTHQNTPV